MTRTLSPHPHPQDLTRETAEELLRTKAPGVYLVRKKVKRTPADGELVISCVHEVRDPSPTRNHGSPSHYTTRMREAAPRAVTIDWRWDCRGGVGDQELACAVTRQLNSLLFSPRFNGMVVVVVVWLLGGYVYL